jgi:hypothetical protein
MSCRAKMSDGSPCNRDVLHGGLCAFHRPEAVEKRKKSSLANRANAIVKSYGQKEKALDIVKSSIGIAMIDNDTYLANDLIVRARQIRAEMDKQVQQYNEICGQLGWTIGLLR